jgi:hypothetical protein
MTIPFGTPVFPIGSPTAIPDGATVYALSGKMGTGKDYVGAQIASLLRERGHRVLCLALADPLKLSVMRDHGCTYEDVFGNKTNRARMLLQQTGSEVRAAAGPDAWVRMLLAVVRMSYDKGNATHFVVTDVRYINEAQRLLEAGAKGLIYVDAPRRNAARLNRESNGDPEARMRCASHTSETEMDASDFRAWVTRAIYNDDDDADGALLAALLATGLFSPN